MVPLKDTNLPPLGCTLGRITALYIGKNGNARSLSVGTTDGLVKRPTAGECVPPLDKGGGPAEGKLSHTVAPHLGKNGIARILAVRAADELAKAPTAEECILQMDEAVGREEN